MRIQACSALCSVGAREEYGTEYLLVWRALLRGLDNAQNIVDFQEIRHRDELINQVTGKVLSFVCNLPSLLLGFTRINTMPSVPRTFPISYFFAASVQPHLIFTSKCGCLTFTFISRFPSNIYVFFMCSKCLFCISIALILISCAKQLPSPFFLLIFLCSYVTLELTQCFHQHHTHHHFSVFLRSAKAYGSYVPTSP